MLRWIEPWYVVYGLLGVAAVGLAPILLPQFVNSHGNAAAVGLVIGAFNLGGLSAPLWGRLAEHRLHKPLMLGGLGATAAGLAVTPALTALSGWIGLALLQGAGIAAISTVAGLLVVEAHPKAQWDQRLGWLQSLYGGGQVIGLLLASLFSGPGSGTGLYWSALLVALGIPLGLLLIRTPPPPPVPLRAAPQPTRAHQAPAGIASAHHHLGHVKWSELRPVLQSSFGLFIVANTLALIGASLIFTAYPILMSDAYHMSPKFSAIAFGVGAGLAVLWYPAAGALSHRWGAGQVLWLSLLLRWVGTGLLLAMAFVPVAGRGWWAEAGFVVIVNSWPFISVAGTVYAAQTSPTDEGTAMGLYNGFAGIGNSAGSFITGLLAWVYGYRSLTVFACGIVLCALLLGLPLLGQARSASRHQKASAPP